MPPRNTSSKRRDFGIFLGSLRDSLKENQREFAKRLFVSRSLIANIEIGRESPTPTLIAHLVEHFPERKAEILAAAARYRRPRAHNSQQKARLNAVQRRVTTLLASNELDEARDYLLNECDTQLDDTGFVIGTLEQLGLVESLRGDHKACRAQLSRAVRLADITPGFETKLGSLWEQIAASYDQDNSRDQAHISLNLALEVTPRAASIWYRKGLIQWDDGDLSGAYTTLTLALTLKGSRLDILYARGQISAELGLADEAIADIIEVLASPQLSSRKATCMRCTHAFARFLQQEPRYLSIPKADNWPELAQQAFSDLNEVVTKMSDSPWPYYFRARCTERQFDVMSRFAGWEKQLHGSLTDDRRKLLVELCREMLTDLKAALKRDNGHFNEYRVKRTNEAILAFKDVVKV